MMTTASMRDVSADQRQATRFCMECSILCAIDHGSNHDFFGPTGSILGIWYVDNLSTILHRAIFESAKTGHSTIEFASGMSIRPNELYRKLNSAVTVWNIAPMVTAQHRLRRGLI
jgi:hypothetical protein